jgi:hypothetical protein
MPQKHTLELTRLTPYLEQHFGWNYKEDVEDEIAYNNYHCAVNVLQNLSQFPKANIGHLEKITAEIPLFWPEVLLHSCAAIAKAKEGR